MTIAGNYDFDFTIPAGFHEERTTYIYGHSITRRPARRVARGRLIEEAEVEVVLMVVAAVLAAAAVVVMVAHARA